MADPAIQSASGSNFGVISQPVTYGSNNIGGNTSVVTTKSDVSADTTCTDSQGNHYTRIATATSGAGNIGAIWVAVGINPGANTVTVHYGGSSDVVVTIIELPASSGVRVSNTATASGASNPSVSLVNTAAGDICASIVCADGTTQTAGLFGSNTAFIKAPVFANTPTQDGVSSGGTINATSVGSGSSWFAIALALLPVTGDVIFFSHDF
jgi:hypothetical protein